MENKKEEKKGKRTFKTFLLIAGTVAVCYEAFARKGQDVQNAYSWVKGKIQSKRSTNNRVENNNQNRQNNNGNWNNKRK